MQKGEIITIPYPFSDLSGFKVRPALILFEYRNEVAVAFIGSQLQNIQPPDVLLQPNPVNGLKKTSFIRITKISTIESAMVQGQIGFIDNHSLKMIDRLLKKLFDL